MERHDVVSLVSHLKRDKQRLAAAIRQRRRIVRSRIAAGMQPGVDAAVDRDLHDVALLSEMVRDLALLQIATHRADPDVPAWLLSAAPSPTYRQVVWLRRRQCAWSVVGARTGQKPSNAATMYREVSRAASLWPQVLEAHKSGLGKRDIALCFGLRRWAVKAILAHAPPQPAPPPSGRYAGDGEFQSPVLARRAPAPYVPPQPGGRRENDIKPPGCRRCCDGDELDEAWWLLAVQSGFAIRVKAEIERRFGARCLTLIAPGKMSPSFAGLLAVQGRGVDLPIEHALGWVGRPSIEAGRWGRRPQSTPVPVTHDEIRSLFRSLGWAELPDEATLPEAEPDPGARLRLTPGVRVRIVDGAFRRQEGVYRSESRRGRVSVALDAGMTVEMPESFVQRVES